MRTEKIATDQEATDNLRERLAGLRRKAFGAPMPAPKAALDRRQPVARPPADVVDMAALIRDALFVLPQDKRLDALAEATRIVANYNGKKYRTFSLSELGDRNLGALHRMKSAVIQRFVRSITNNNSPENADKILFADHHGRMGAGSGRLLDYICDLATLRKYHGQATRGPKS